MPKAQLVTRQETSGTNTENLNKASALTHAEMDKNLIGLRDSSWTIADDTSTTLNVTDDKTIYIQGSGTVSTALSGDTLTLTGSGISASSTDTLTNKTFDANGTGNSISNIETADIAAATLVTAAEGIGSNNNDTTLPTSAAVKAYADSVGGGSITALNNQAENRLVSIGSTTTELDGEANLTFDGSTLAVTGNITATTSIANDAITIDDNVITTSRSNDNLQITANGTGRIDIDEKLADSTQWSGFYGSVNRPKSLAVSKEDLAVDASSTDRIYVAAFHQGTKLSATGAGSDFRPRTVNILNSVDLDGYNYTNTGISRGPVGISNGTRVFNSNTTPTAATIAGARGISNLCGISDFNSPTANITLDRGIGIQSQVFVEGNGSNNKTLTDAYSFYGDAYVDEGGSGTSGITNNYAFYTPGTGGTNNYAFYSNSDTAKSRVGTLERYRETINALTSSSTITVDCGLAPIHTVTLGTSTGFVISNLGTGQSVTIIITNGGSHTATFGTDGSTAVKFPGGAPTITASGTDVVTVFNDGTNYLGNIAQAYA